MNNIETSHHKKIVAAENVGFRFEADLFNSVQLIIDLCVMDSIGTFCNKKRVVAENVGFIFEAELFKSVPMILDFGCHERH